MNPWALGLTSRSRRSWRPLSWITWWWTDCQFSQWLSCHSIFKILLKTCDALKNNTTREAVGWHDVLCVSYQDVQEDQVGQVDRVDHVQRSPRKIPQSQIALNQKQTRINWRNHWEKNDHKIENVDLLCSNSVADVLYQSIITFCLLDINKEYYSFPLGGSKVFSTCKF